MDNIIGHKIVAIRPTTPAEQEQMFWYDNGLVLELDNGVCLMPTVDEEANGPGVMLYDADGSRSYSRLLSITKVKTGRWRRGQ
jgi:hypothetical protein